MKEILKNKAIIGLFIVILGFTYIKSIPTTLGEDNYSSSNNLVYQSK